MKGAPLPDKVPGQLARRLGGHRLLFAILILALLRGLLYLALMPPWQHYDEPTHFEYVRLIAERRRLPQPGDYDLAMRREIAASMQAHNFWRGAAPPLDLWSDTPPEIGLSELKHPPLYYGLLALPQLLLDHQDVETQLYAARLCSLLFYLLTVAAAYGLTFELLPSRRWLAAAVGVFVALLPPFADLGSSVNNDVAVAAFTSLLLWSSVRLLRRGPTPGRVAATLLLVGASFATKNTSVPVAIAALLVLAIRYGLSKVTRGHGRWILTSLLLFVPILLLVGFTWNSHAAHWYGEPPTMPNSLEEADTTFEAVLGSRLLVLARDSQAHPRSLSQELGRDASRGLQGQVVTFGAWLRSGEGEPGTASLGVYDGTAFQWHTVEATPEWRFHAFTTAIRPDARGVSVQIRVPGKESGPTLYADAMVLAKGEMPGAGAPQFQDKDAKGGHWGGQALVNLIQNGSAERTWPSLRPWLGDVQLYGTQLGKIFHSALDLKRTGWVYGSELQRFFQTFWGVFAWGHLALPRSCFYLLGLVSALAVVGVTIGLASEIRSSGAQSWRRWSWALLVLSLLLTWGGILLRIHPVFLTSGSLYWPVARYASGVIAPTSLLLCLGLAKLVPRRWQGIAAYAGLLGMLALEVVALWITILPYYYYG